MKFPGDEQSIEKGLSKMKKGILVVSFGTSHLDTMEKTIDVIERDVSRKFPECRVYRAFTSRMIIRKLKRTENMAVDTVEEAVKRMASDGIEDVIVQPTHIINGIENDRMMEDLMENMSCFKRIRVGKPLLSSVDDYKKSIHAVMAETELSDDEMLVLMGCLWGTVRIITPTRHIRRWSIHFMRWDIIRCWSEPWRASRN